jgi:hypothetical protein
MDMATPLNLTLKRGPSVWEKPKPGPSPWQVYGALGGALLVGLAIGSRSNRSRLLGLALGIAGASLFADRLASTIGAGSQFLADRGARKDRIVDRASEDSFPASDPTPYL